MELEKGTHSFLLDELDDGFKDEWLCVRRPDFFGLASREQDRRSFKGCARIGAEGRRGPPRPLIPLIPPRSLFKVRETGVHREWRLICGAVIGGGRGLVGARPKQGFVAD